MRFTYQITTASLAACLLLGCGCRSKDQPSPQSGRDARPALTLLAPESLNWSRDEACAKLDDAKLGISAAVRLVRLAAVSPLCVPAELTDGTVCRLRLVRLSESRWALGLIDTESSRRVRAPVLIATAGDVELLAEGAEEELLVLHLSDDPAVFPHVFTLPDRVLMLGDEVVRAIALAPNQRVRFELREQQGYSYIGLMLAGQPVEAARYKWDPYELAFMGPAVDKLPDPPGGEFEVDLETSQRLVPLGGEIPVPESQPAKPRQPQPPVTGEESLPM